MSINSLYKLIKLAICTEGSHKYHFDATTITRAIAKVKSLEFLARALTSYIYSKTLGF